MRRRRRAVVNLSVAVASPSPNKEKKLEEALSYAAHRDTIVVVAAGNLGTIGSSAYAYGIKLFYPSIRKLSGSKGRKNQQGLEPVDLPVRHP